jgi:hypothetical protein
MSTELLERAKLQLLDEATEYVHAVTKTCPNTSRTRVAAVAVMSLLEVFKREGILPQDIFAEFPKAAERRKAQN